MVCFIWGNSIIPGSESGGMSLAVRDAVRAALAGIELPAGWVTNLLVRKTGHFSEYAILGALVLAALRAAVERDRVASVAVGLILVAVSSLDEAIQLLVPGRMGLLSDVLLDCCGAASGVMACALIAHVVRRRRCPEPEYRQSRP